MTVCWRYTFIQFLIFFLNKINVLSAKKQPFWPTGSGCARGFLSSLDAAYAMKLWANQRNSILAVLAQRESIYRLLAQTTPANLHRDINSYTLDPVTRYPALNQLSVEPIDVKHLLDTDDLSLLEPYASNAAQQVTNKRKRRANGKYIYLSQ